MTRSILNLLVLLTSFIGGLSSLQGTTNLYTYNNYTSSRSDYEGYGESSPKTNRPKTIKVRPYYRKDGTRIPGHYRSPPQKNSYQYPSNS